MENWRFIAESPDYMISDHGRVLSFKGKSKLILSSQIISKGYEQVHVSRKGIQLLHCVHRLVAQAFLPNPHHLPQVNHLDGNKLNNRVENLEWCDAYDNVRHAFATGLYSSGTGAKYRPCAVTDEKGNVLRAYPSMEALGTGERLKSVQRDGVRCCLRHPEHLTQHAVRRMWHDGTAFLTHPSLEEELAATAAVMAARPEGAPMWYATTRQYYRCLTVEEALEYGVASDVVRRKVERERQEMQERGMYR